MSALQTAIDVQTVSKRFRLYKEKYTSLKEKVLHAGKVPYEDFWALKDVELEVRSGETLGILGRNGSGKSTLLKCIAGILQPTSGQIVVRGHLAAMLELGAGFQPEMSGRDNIYLNASLLGTPAPGDRASLRRHRRVRGARGVHRQPGAVLLLRHVRPARLRGRGERRTRRAAHRRGARRRRRALPAEVPGPFAPVPDARAGRSSSCLTLPT